MILSTNKGGQITSVLFSHGPNKAFLVPDSCRVTETVTVFASTSQRIPLKLLEQRLFRLFTDNFSAVLDFLTLHDKHNIHTLSENI